MDRKLCRDCKWYSDTTTPRCLHPNAASLVDDVNIATSTMRAKPEDFSHSPIYGTIRPAGMTDDMLCGPEGQWYERPNRLLRMAIAPWMFFWYGVIIALAVCGIFS